jgi:hypothetical protein
MIFVYILTAAVVFGVIKLLILGIFNIVKKL